MFKMTEIKLELISNIDIHLFVKKGMRVGIFYIAKWYSKANNKYTKSYDDSKPSKYFMYFEVNNFYGRAISQYLSYRKFN